MTRVKVDGSVSKMVTDIIYLYRLALYSKIVYKMPSRSKQSPEPFPHQHNRFQSQQT